MKRYKRIGLDKNKIKILSSLESQRSAEVYLKELTELAEGGDINHIGRVNSISWWMATKLAESKKYKSLLSSSDILDISMAVELHDVGKLRVPAEIIKKPGKLTDVEYAEIKNHVKYGEDIVNEVIKRHGNNTFLIKTLDAVKYHHERWDGSGYPYGLSKEKIPLVGRIAAIADVYDAIRALRSYKIAWSHEDSVDYILKNSDVLFDPQLSSIVFKHSEELREVYESTKILGIQMNNMI